MNATFKKTLNNFSTKISHKDISKFLEPIKAIDRIYLIPIAEIRNYQIRLEFLKNIIICLFILRKTVRRNL